MVGYWGAIRTRNQGHILTSEYYLADYLTFGPLTTM
jgi:hypothetical protein